MPTLVNDLTPSQRVWLVETFGNSDEDDEPLHPHLGPGPYDGIEEEDERRYAMESHNTYGSYYQTLPSPAPPPPPPQQQQDYESRRIIFRRSPNCLPLDPDYQQLPPPHSSNPHHHPHNPPPHIPIGPWHEERPMDHYYYERRGIYDRPPGPRARSPILQLQDTDMKDVALMQNVDALSEKQALENDHDRPIFPHKGDKLTWQQSFENLQVYKKLVGDCNVPQKYKFNSKLGGWVNKQRKKKKNPSKYGKLTASQVTLLENLGFKWNVEQGN